MIGITSQLLRNAEQGRYAVPAVNVVDHLSLRAVIRSAARHRAPLIVQISARTARSMGVRLVSEMFTDEADRVDVPVALHLDHCPDRDLITEVVDAGWSSVLFDASDRDLETARRETAEVTAYAHPAGVEVESEIENIVGVEDGVGSDRAVHSYSIDTLVQVAKETATDLVAPALGTAHGMYTQAPILRPDRVEALRAATGLPVVLHGGTGLTDAQFAEFIAAGVSKINISTALKIAYLKAAKGYLDQALSVPKYDPPKLFDAVESAIDSEIGRYIEVFGAAGRIGGTPR